MSLRDELPTDEMAIRVRISEPSGVDLALNAHKVSDALQRIASPKTGNELTPHGKRHLMLQRLWLEKLYTLLSSMKEEQAALAGFTEKMITSPDHYSDLWAAMDDVGKKIANAISQAEIAEVEVLEKLQKLSDP